VLIRPCTLGSVTTPGKPRITPNQLAALNMARWRKAAGLTQDELGERLGGWSNVEISAHERSAYSARPRRFDADKLLALAAALDVPLAAMLLPPEDDGWELIMPEPATGAGMGDLLAFLFPDPGAGDTPAGAAYRDAFTAAVRRYLDQPRGDELIRYLDEMDDRERRAELAERLGAQAQVLRTVLADLESLRRAVRQEDDPDGQ